MNRHLLLFLFSSFVSLAATVFVSFLCRRFFPSCLFLDLFFLFFALWLVPELAVSPLAPFKLSLFSLKEDRRLANKKDFLSALFRHFFCRQDESYNSSSPLVSTLIAMSDNIVDFILNIIEGLSDEFQTTDKPIRSRSQSETGSHSSGCSSSSGGEWNHPDLTSTHETLGSNESCRTDQMNDSGIGNCSSVFGRGSNSWKDFPSFLRDSQPVIPSSSFVNRTQDFSSFNRFVKSPRQRNIPVIECSFCKQNRERPEVYRGHVLKDSTTGIVVCPILRKYHCPICHEPGGDFAHTKRYCPKNLENGTEPQSSFPHILKSKLNSAGKRVVPTRVQWRRLLFHFANYFINSSCLSSSLSFSWINSLL